MYDSIWSDDWSSSSAYYWRHNMKYSHLVIAARVQSINQSRMFERSLQIIQKASSGVLLFKFKNSVKKYSEESVFKETKRPYKFLYKKLIKMISVTCAILPTAGQTLGITSTSHQTSTSSWMLMLRHWHNDWCHYHTFPRHSNLTNQN